VRNDARPIGETAGQQSPVSGGHPSDQGEARSEHRDRVSHDRRSQAVNEGTAEHVRRKDANQDPALPTGDSSLRVKI